MQAYTSHELLTPLKCSISLIDLAIENKKNWQNLQLAKEGLNMVLGQIRRNMDQSLLQQN